MGVNPARKELIYNTVRSITLALLLLISGQLILPHIMLDSKIPRMINMQPYKTPITVKLTLTGRPCAYLGGTPQYTSMTTPVEKTRLTRICIPRNLADNLFYRETYFL